MGLQLKAMAPPLPESHQEEIVLQSGVDSYEPFLQLCLTIDVSILVQNQSDVHSFCEFIISITCLFQEIVF